MKNILITGGSGFLGINLVRYLLKKGYKITILDIAPFNYIERKKISFINGDIRNEKIVAKVMKNQEIVIHAAAALPLYSKKDIYTTDILGTKILLKYAKKYKIKKFIHISSTAVYGIPKKHPINENMRLIGVGPYGISKIKAEKECLKYRKKGMCITILRPKSFIGKERLGIFALLYEWAKDKKNFPLVGNGKNIYQLLDVEDLCESIFLCIKKDKKIVNDTFNIGAKKFTTIKEDFQSVLNEAGFNKKIILFPVLPSIFILKILKSLKFSPIYEWVYETIYTDSYVSIERAEKKLNFKPKYSNKDALLKNYNWYLENYKKLNKHSGVSHRLPWKQGFLKIIKIFF